MGIPHVKQTGPLELALSEKALELTSKALRIYAQNFHDQPDAEAAGQLSRTIFAGPFELIARVRL